MWKRGLIAVCLAGCGSEPAARRDSRVPDPQTDAPMLPPACAAEVRGTAIHFELVAETQGAAVLVTSPRNDVRRFVVEQEGRIKIMTDAGLLPTPFLDLSDTVRCCGEQGLLGLAFHPDYAMNGTFYVYYSTSDANIVARYQASASDPDRADPASGVPLMSMLDLATNHNGGMLEFGPDGYLYISTGDGGWDSQLGQNPNGPFGKILRLDVSRAENGKEYAIPPTNPFADGVAGAPEVLHMGLRNPWRWSFDTATGDMWIGDVGQWEIEEVDVIAAGTPGPLNFGWHKYEGSSCFAPPCDPAGFAMPQIEKTHAEGWCSVIGGQVYRGSCYPDLVETYFATDYCKAELIGATRVGPAVTVALPTTTYRDTSGLGSGAPPTPSSLHADARGELYLTTTTVGGNTLRGGVYRLTVQP